MLYPSLRFDLEESISKRSSSALCHFRASRDPSGFSKSRARVCKLSGTVSLEGPVFRGGAKEYLGLYHEHDTTKQTNAYPADIASVANSGADYLVFYSSVDKISNQMWCPDCRRVEDIVCTAFEPADAPSALIVYVGLRRDWKGNSNNPFRGSPWNISSVPTILRRDGARLVDDEIDEESLASFTNA
ncbi:hypothetical protein ACEPAI_559 [Sanghuangporus weigelae]